MGGSGANGSSQKNKPTEIKSKKSIYALHLELRFKDTPLDEIDVAVIAQLRADLVEKELSEKRINNILAVPSKRSTTRPSAT